MLIRSVTLLFIIALAISWSCGDFCNVYDVQKIDGLAGGNAIVAYVVRCGATGHNSISVTWKKKDLDLKGKRGEIFYAIDGDDIKIERISADSVKIYYLAWDVKVKKELARGITFIYEAKGLEFFEKE
ncbi:MAG: hypothetical protein GY839_11095 [candidate division Zixibacteria bacterium]|nr:hypothetical protein [candidate division Zixibacteria bacterium]